jgi:hypothetical protein
MQLLSEFSGSWKMQLLSEFLGPWKMQLLSEFLGTLENATFKRIFRDLKNTTFACTELRCPLSKIRKPLHTPTTLERYLTPARGK